jgi:hypothetical protein
MVVPKAGRKGLNRHPWLYAGVLLVVLIIAGWILFARATASGDPGGKVIKQLIPAASALPGYGTPSLPWTVEPSLSKSYLLKIEPQRDSCDGIAGTQGWSQVVLQAAFRWPGTSQALMARVGARLVALGWRQAIAPDEVQAGWMKRLDNGSTATAMLNLSPLGPPSWEFVATAPPVGKPASGC